MIKYEHNNNVYLYYEENKHILATDMTNDTAAKIIKDLILSQDFQIDQTILTALYRAMRKLQGFSDTEINRLCI